MALVRSGVPTSLELHAAEGGKLNSLSVSISEPQSSAEIWEVKIEAIYFKRAAIRELGRVDTVPPIITQTPSRVVALATCPGCSGFRVMIDAPAAQTAQECTVELGEVPYLHAAAGVIAVEPHAILHGNRFAYLSAALPAGGTVVAIPRNQRVHTVTGWALAAGGTMALGAGAAIPIPAASSVQLAPAGFVRGPVNVTFAAIPAATGGYIIELGT